MLALARPLWLAVACLVLVVGTYFAFQGLGSNLLPSMDEGAFILDYYMPRHFPYRSKTAAEDIPRVRWIYRRWPHAMPFSLCSCATGDHPWLPDW
ncbi:MAG: hypothetical protein ABI076_08645 [Acidobacteriaceae bacterium]